MAISMNYNTERKYPSLVLTTYFSSINQYNPSMMTYFGIGF